MSISEQSYCYLFPSFTALEHTCLWVGVGGWGLGVGHLLIIFNIKVVNKWFCCLITTNKCISAQVSVFIVGWWHFHYRPTTVRWTSQKATQDALSCFLKSERAESYFREHPSSYASQQAAPLNNTLICWYSDSINISLVSYKALLL